ncbi:MAG TPA: NADPH-dependent FMN reductase [Bryobacterales bacterium]|nr:NADPH-dependent FMN reductase [Bryobacterales bacterium]
MKARERKEPPIHVAGIGGSIRPGSYTRMAVEQALRGAAEAGASTKLIDLRGYQLIFCDGKEDESAYPQDVTRLRKDVQQADGIILGTPEYHGSFSGVLKNALDLMGFEEFEGKMVGLVGVSGGRLGAFDGLNGLRHIGRALHAWVIPEQAAVPEAWKVFDGAGKIKDEEVAKRLMEVGRQVARFARIHKCGQHAEFVKCWEESVANPGG